MNSQKMEIIESVINFFGDLAGADSKTLDNFINSFKEMSLDEVIDNTLIILSDAVEKGLLTEKEILVNADKVIQIYPEKYNTVESLVGRLDELRSMNITHMKMSLEENHKQVLCLFSNFSKLLEENDFDYFYTGGIFAYISQNLDLERYHSDLDVFFNEDELFKLKRVIDSSDEYEFVSLLADKRKESGHEYIIKNRNTKLEVGLFLFARDKKNESIIRKEYFRDRKNPDEELLVNKRYYSKEGSDLCFLGTKREYNGILYKMVSLEYLYSTKKNARPRDRRDADLMRNNVNMLSDYKIDVEKNTMRKEIHQSAACSPVSKLEKTTMNLNNISNISITTI